MRRVLVVDDDEGVRGCISQILRDEGFDVVEACDGADALRRLRVGVSPALVIADGRMPNLDGYALRAAMAADDGLARIPFILASATPDEDHARRLGIAARLDKPFGLERLVATVRRVLSLRSSSVPDARASSPTSV